MKTSLMICASLLVLMVAATGCYEVVYTVEWKGDSCIKFEDAMYDQDPDPALEDWIDACLGEDGAVEADGFVVVLDSPVDEILVSLKAGGGKNGGTVSDIPVPTDGSEVSVGSFLVAAEEFDDGDEEIFTYEIDVFSDDDNKTAALSHITFCFGEGVTLISPIEGDYSTLRAEEGNEEIIP